MSEYPSWQYDEMKLVGKDYCDCAEVEAYDARHGKVRNVELENERILAKLQIRPQHVVIDIGTGTGAFAIKAARYCTSCIFRSNPATIPDEIGHPTGANRPPLPSRIM